MEKKSMKVTGGVARELIMCLFEMARGPQGFRKVSSATLNEANLT